MMTRNKVAIFYQNESARKHAQAVEWRDRINNVSDKGTFTRWLYGDEWIEAYTEHWKVASTMAEAYSIAARMIMGMDE